MADLSDVENALVSTVVGVLYPGGTQIPSTTGQVVKIYRGWPANIGLNADLSGGICNVSVFSDPKSTKETTRYPRVWREVSRVPRTLFANVVGSSVSLNGVPMPGQIVGVEVDGQPYTVPVRTNDTGEKIASRLAALVPDSTASGTTLSVSDATVIVARVAEGGRAVMETRRQEQDVLISVWCPDPSARDILSTTIDLALSQIDWLQFPDGSAGLLRYRSTAEVDTSENASLYRRDLLYNVEYPTVVAATLPAMVFGRLSTGGVLQDGPEMTAAPPGGTVLLGAIRFDAWYDPSSTIDQQCAAALSNPSWADRLPPNAIVDGSNVTWPLATQMTLDLEIKAALTAGIDFWAFDSYAPNDGLSRALSLYLSSQIRSQLKFCMLGQSSEWGDPTSGSGYSTTLAHDVAMMLEPGYVTVLDGRPLYLVLDATSGQLADLPNADVGQAIAYVRSEVTAKGLANPYVVWLSAAALADYDNVSIAKSIGADAAGAYATPRLTGTTQAYSSLISTAETDWAARSEAGLDMIGTAMTGWDQRPVIEAPQPFYPISPSVGPSDYYIEGLAQDVANHVAALKTFTQTNPGPCRAGVGLIYAWNELVEGGWLMPTYGQSGPQEGRVDALGEALLKLPVTATTPATYVI